MQQPTGTTTTDAVNLDRRIRPIVSKNVGMRVMRGAASRSRAKDADDWIKLRRESIVPIISGSMVVNLEDA